MKEIELSISFATFSNGYRVFFNDKLAVMALVTEYTDASRRIHLYRSPNMTHVSRGDFLNAATEIYKVGADKFEKAIVNGNKIELIRKPETSWLINGLIANKSNVLITGLPKSGKTRLALTLAYTLSKGGSLFNLGKFKAVQQTTGPIVYVDGLNNAKLFKDTLYSLGIPREDICYLGDISVHGIVEPRKGIVIFDHMDGKEDIDYSKYQDSLVIHAACTGVIDYTDPFQGSCKLASNADTLIHLERVGTSTLFRYDCRNECSLDGILLESSKQAFSVVS